jgi:KipI family sensor histidine kinase inhibitor
VIRPFGEAAYLVELGSTARVHALADDLRDAPLHGVVECVPGIETMLVEFDPLAVDAGEIGSQLASRLGDLGERPAPAGRHRSIPVVYGGELGPDLDEVARLTGLAPDDVVRLHGSTDLVVEILGFAPGFPYLGTLPAELDVPRLATPRTVTPAGAVAIAGRRSGIYPAPLPGGWRVIGRTPLSLFDPRRDPPAYLAPGDRVRFVPMTVEAWASHAGAPPDW